MLDLAEIKQTIKELEQGQTTFNSCSKLADLYTVLAHQVGQAEEPQARFYIPPNASEFYLLATQVPFEVLLNVMDEHMNAIQLLYPKEYDKILRKLQQA